MSGLVIRRAVKEDIPSLERLLYQVARVHSDVRPDLFKAGERKYTEDELKGILADNSTPVFAAERNGEVLGYAFCVHKQFVDSNIMTNVKTLYIDDLCVDENARGGHIGTKLYEYVLNYAKENGCYNVTLNVWADNVSAVKFYEKIGMRVQKIGMEKIL